MLAALRRRIRPLMRRRTKEQVAAELPPKQEQVLEVLLNPKHRKVYDTHLQRERRKVLGLVDDLQRNRFTIFRSLTLLRQLALDASLVDEAYAGIRSSKVDAFLEHLQEVVAEGHRALVFSQFTGFLSTVRKRLDAEGLPYAYLDGRTRDRQRRIDEFRERPRPGLPDQPQSGRLRTQPDRGRLRVRARSVVEPGGRGAGGRPHPPDRPGQGRDGVPAGGRRHHRGEGAWRSRSASAICSLA